MNGEKFSEYIERTFSENLRGKDTRQAYSDKEKLAWQLHENAAPAGSVLLGDDLIRKRVSYCRSDIDVLPFARTLLREGFAALSVKEAKDGWDWYWLGMCHEMGRGTPANHAKAAECFGRARDAGNAYAHYEEIWSAYLADGSTLQAIFRFRYCGGPLQPFAELSARSLALLEMGPPRQIGSTQHVCRVLEISRLFQEFYFHDGAKRHINVRIEKEFRSDLENLAEMATPAAALTLYLIARESRSNPTGKKPEHWLRAAVHPENAALLPIMKRQIYDENLLQLIASASEENGWGESDICRYAKWALANREADDDGVSEWFP